MVYFVIIHVSIQWVGYGILTSNSPTQEFFKLLHHNKEIALIKFGVFQFPKNVIKLSMYLMSVKLLFLVLRVAIYVIVQIYWMLREQITAEFERCISLCNIKILFSFLCGVNF